MTQRKKRQSISPDLTPLIDVVFILLIFFIVTSVFKKEELALSLNLPSSNSTQLEVKLKDVSIELSNNSLAIFGTKIPISELNKNLKKIKNKKKQIIIRIDKNVKYEKIVKILDALKQHELNNLSLVTNLKK